MIILIQPFCTFSNTRCPEEGGDDDTASSSSASCSPTLAASNLHPQCESAENLDNVKNDIIIKKTVSTVRTTHSGNSKSVSVSVKKTNSAHNALPKAESPRSSRPVPALRRITRNIPAGSTISESYVKNIVTNTNSSNQNLNDVDNCVKIQNSQIKSVRLLNNLNKFKSKAFSTPMKSEEDA